MKFRSWLTVITIILLGVVIFFGWPEITRAWGLVGRVNIWVLAILVPIQVFSYYSAGEVIFSYLRAKGDLKNTSRWQMARMALELNFVNHILPSGGVAGFSYMGWVLGRHGVSAGRATMAQIVRYSMMYISFVMVLLVAVIVLAFDNEINKTIIFTSGALAIATVLGAIFVIYAMGNQKKLKKLAGWVTRTVNKVVNFATISKVKKLLELGVVEDFFEEIHQDYLAIIRDKKILLKPMLWSLLINVLDASLLMIAFLALGFWVNPAALFIGFGLASIASAFSATVGGTGVYEAVMVGFMASAGVSADVAIAGTVLARVVLLFSTVVFGYIFYQLTINQYGKTPK